MIRNWDVGHSWTLDINDETLNNQLMKRRRDEELAMHTVRNLVHSGESGQSKRTMGRNKESVKRIRHRVPKKEIGTNQQYSSKRVVRLRRKLGGESLTIFLAYAHQPLVSNRFLK